MILLNELHILKHSLRMENDTKECCVAAVEKDFIQKERINSFPE